MRWCRDCCGIWRRANVDRLIETNKRCRLRKPEQYRLAARKTNLRQYGMLLEDYDALLRSQNGKCAICSVPEPGGHNNRFHVDHDHISLQVRGLLCHHCNKGLGQLKDSVAVLSNAITYLNNAKTQFTKKGG